MLQKLLTCLLPLHAPLGLCLALGLTPRGLLVVLIPIPDAAVVPFADKGLYILLRALAATNITIQGRTYWSFVYQVLAPPEFSVGAFMPPWSYPPPLSSLGKERPVRLRA